MRRLEQAELQPPSDEVPVEAACVDASRLLLVQDHRAVLDHVGDGRLRAGARRRAPAWGDLADRGVREVAFLVDDREEEALPRPRRAPDVGPERIEVEHPPLADRTDAVLAR